MKILLSTLIGMLIILPLVAQTPQSFNYQAILRDDAGEIITKRSIEIDLALLKGSTEGTAVYSEVHNTKTNAFGLVNLQIGQGATSDDFSTINWEEGPFFLRVALDGIELGTSQMVSVPYALYAQQAGNVFSGSFNDLINIPDGLDLDRSDDFSGSYKDLTDIPPNLDPSNNFSGSFKDLSDIPETLDTDTTDDFSGDYNDLINKPRIPEPTKQVFDENDSAIFISDKKVGIGTEQARARLEVFKGGVLFAGDSGTVDIAGQGTRLMWIPEKAAFRAGFVSEDQWDLDAIGYYSVAIGYSAVASVDAATAFGGFTLASGFNATAMGYSTQATEYAATAMGNNTIASGNSSLAMGFQTQALGERSPAMGDATKASGNASTAMGLRIEASGTAATSLGNLTKATGFASLATGSLSLAPGNVSTAIGFYSAARGSRLVSIGSFGKANHIGSIVLAANSSIAQSDSIASAVDEQIVLRADGVTVPNEPTKLINTSTGAFLSTGGTWTNASDQHLKENFTSIEAEALLEKIKALEVTSWNYKADDESITHIGPMAQHFYLLYGLGNDDKSIATVDGIGVALATIKALQERNEMLEARLQDLERIVEMVASLQKSADLK